MLLPEVCLSAVVGKRKALGCRSGEVTGMHWNGLGKEDRWQQHYELAYEYQKEQPEGEPLNLRIKASSLA